MAAFDPNIPLYQQIVSLMKRSFVSGEYAPGEKIPSIRELALLYQVTPNTIQRALSLLEQEALITTERTNGKYVTEDSRAIKRLREEILTEQVRSVLHSLREHGYTDEEIRRCMEKKMASAQIQEIQDKASELH